MEGSPGVILWFQRLADDVHYSSARLLVEGEGGEAMELSRSGPFGLLVEQETSDLCGEGTGMKHI